MYIGHYPCKNLLPFGVGDTEGVCKITKENCFKSDDVTDCPYRNDLFKRVEY